MSFAEILPEGWQYIEAYRLDTDGDGEREWAILYYFDVLDEARPQGAPIGVVVYKLDDNTPPNITAHDLRPPNGDYLCECKCVPNMESVLSGLEGDELVVRDWCDEQTTRLTVFHWDADRNEYESLGHFRGDHIEIEKDQVTVEERQPGRAQVAEVETYHPDENKTYYLPGGQCRPCTEEELCFCYGEPKEVLCFRYPEKVVMGFYSQYNDDEKATAYFVEDVRDRLGRCDASECGCIAPRHQIAHVWVTDLQVEYENESQDPKRAIVGVTVTCERRDGAKEGERYIRWHLAREGGCWRLERPE